MLSVMSTDHGQTTRMAIICIGAFAVLNAAFYFLSGSYFDSHRQIVDGVSVPSYAAEQMAHIRTNFAVFSGVVAAGSLIGGIRARVVGHLLPVVLGAANIVGGIWALTRGLPSVLGITLWVSGSLMVVLSWYSYRRSRPAWAFLVAICGVLAVVEFFGAPKIRGGLDIGLWTAMILPGLNAVATFVLVSLRGEYVERDPVTA